MADQSSTEEQIRRLTSRIRKLESQSSAQRDPTNPAIALSTELHDLGIVPSALLRNEAGATVAITNNTATIMDWNTIVADSPPMADITNNRINSYIDGIYIVNAFVFWETNATGIRRATIEMTDGTTSITVAADSKMAVTTAAHLTHHSIAAIVRVNMNGPAGYAAATWTTRPYFQVRVFQTSGGDLDVQLGSLFSAVKIGDTNFSG